MHGGENVLDLNKCLHCAAGAEEQSHVEQQTQNKEEEQILNQREKAGSHPPEHELIQKEEKEKQRDQDKCQSTEQELFKIAAERQICPEQHIRREAEQGLLEEQQLRMKMELRVQQVQEEAELKRQELEEQVRVQEQALQNAEAAFKVAMQRKSNEVKEVEAELESFMRTKNEEVGRLKSQLKSACDENKKLTFQLQKMQAPGLETTKSIRGGGARIITVKRKIDNPGGVGGEEGNDVQKVVYPSSRKREATTSNQDEVVKLKKVKGYRGTCDENENLDISGEVEDEDVVEVEEDQQQPGKVERSKIVMCKKCKDALPTKESLKLHTCGNISSVGNMSSRRK